MGAKELSDTLKSENATRNIERLSRMSREEIESEYKSTNRIALSDDDNIEQRVNDAFLRGEGLEDITIGGKAYKGLLFDENSQQSQKLKKNETFQNYYNNYLSCMKEIIGEHRDGKEIDTEATSKILETKLGKPDFSNWGDIPFYDYYGLMGGTQNIEVDFEITPLSNGEYILNTTMYINDWYGADDDDISKSINYSEVVKSIAKFPLNTLTHNAINVSKNYKELKANYKDIIPGLKAFFYLQHSHGCKPFPTQIVYKSTDKMKIYR